MKSSELLLWQIADKKTTPLKNAKLCWIKYDDDSLNFKAESHTPPGSQVGPEGSDWEWVGRHLRPQKELQL